MKKPIKYLIAVLICCISTALLVFGVYSARQISYSLSGTINYEVNTLYTDVTTSLYALNLPLEQSEVSVNSKMYSLQNSLSESKPLPQDVVKIGDLNNYSTMGNGVSTENTLTASENFSINYGDYIQDSQVPTSPAFYLVFEVKNYSSSTISALLDLTNLIENTTNTLTNPTITKANIYGKTTGQEYSTYYFVVELSFDKHSILKTSNFDNITFTVNAGELVTTPQSQFTFSTSGDTATITKYNGTDTDVVIPSHLEDGKTVTTIGSSAFYGNTTIKSVYIPDTVTTISSSSSSSYGAFNNCKNLTIVDIQGNSLSSIGGHAFYNCSSLTSINIPNSVTSIRSDAFEGCESLISIIIPNSGTSIGSEAFRYCSSLTSVTIPNSVTSIGSYPFDSCNNLKEVNFIGSVNDWLKRSFISSGSNPLDYGADLYINGELLTKITEEDFKNTDGTYITKINDHSFNGCKSLTSIIVPDSVTSIGSCSFDGCSSLTSINIPKSVTSIGSFAFRDCSSLTSITIPNSVTSIGSHAFSSCSNLKEVNYLGSVNDWLKISFVDVDSTPLYNGVELYINGKVITEITEENFKNSDGTYITKINNSAFNNWKSLTSITIPESVEKIGIYAFYNCDSLTSITIPNSVTSIGSYAFTSCDSLTSITIPDSVTSIGSYAFQSCTNLREVTLPTNDSFKTINSYTFRDCSSLTSITIPNSVTSIGSEAFDGCESLTSVTIPNSVTSIGSYAFYECSNLKEVHYLGTINDWLKISFSNSSSNPVSYAKNLYINGELLTEVKEDDFVGLTEVKSYAFRGCESLLSVTIPSSVTSIGSYAFYGCSNLKEVTLPTNDSFKTINSYTFRDCSSLISVTIPGSVTSIGSYAFYNCTNLKLVFNLSNITITAESSSNGYVGYYAKQVINTMPNQDNFYEDETGQHYKTDDGTIITLGYTLTIPDGTIDIAESLVTSLLLEGITKSDITKVVIPSSVTTMKNDAFRDFSNLKEVNFIGSVNDWLKISFGNEYSNPLNNGADLYINGELLTEITENDFAGLTEVNSYAFRGCESLLSVTIPESVESIGNYTFYNCSSLTSITIPNSVTSIGSSAFYSCNNLKKVNFIGSVNDWLKISFSGSGSNPLNEGANLYINGELLTEITEDDFVGLTTIKSYTFSGCESLLNVTVPNTVTSIGSEAFSDCDNLKEVTLPANDSFKTINSYIFYNCTSLTSITMPKSVTSIGSYAFYECSNLKEVNYLGSVNDWLKISFGGSGSNPLNEGANLYINGELLTEVKEDDFVGITAIKSYVFYGCESLTSITIPNSVTSIGSSAFSGCTNLKEVHYLGTINDWLKISFSNSDSNPLYNGSDLYINGNLLTEITEDDFVGLTAIKSYVFYGCESLLSVIIPITIESIGIYAFSSCTNLREITLPTNDSFKTINSGTFYNCSSLTSITIPNSVTSIGSSAFYSCDSLTSVTIPNSVTSIGSSAFYNCASLATITIPSNVTSIGSDAFYNCNALYRVIVESETVLKGLTGTSSSVMGGLLSRIDDKVDRIYVLNTMEASIPDYIKSNWVQLKNTETVDGKEYIIFRHE